MAELWKAKLEQRLALQKRLSILGELDKYAQEQRDLRKDWIHTNIYRGYGSEEPDKFATNQENVTPIAAE